MKAGYIQFAPVLGDLQATMDRLEPLLDQGADADLLVLPELCNSGYNLPDREFAFSHAESISESRFLDFLQTKATKHNQYLVTGFLEKEGELLYNSSVLLGPKGIIGTYRKIHLFLNEKDIFEPGNLPLEVFDIGICRIGMLVCFDWVFPEAWRALALKGAEVICHPSNLVLPFAQRTVPAYSTVNRVYIITANRIGKEGDLTFTGGSILVDPFGEVQLQSEKTTSEVCYSVIDPLLTQNKWITQRNHLFKDRREDFYTE